MMMYNGVVPKMINYELISCRLKRLVEFGEIDVSTMRTEVLERKENV